MTTSRYAPVLLGIVNVSPESMVEESIARTGDEVLQRAEILSKAGATIIDLGARSITPDAPMIGDAAEQARLLPALALLKDQGYVVSVDTWSPATAIAALDEGADLVNFTGGELTKSLIAALRAAGAAVIVTYMPYGNAYRMRDARPVRYTIQGILDHLAPRVREARENGIDDIVIDPNVGIIHPRSDDYAKIHLQHEVLWRLDEFRVLECPIMLYAARKPERLARIMMASDVIHARPDYIRTHNPEVIDRLMHADA